MKPAAPLLRESPLLKYAISKLDPEVFSHPVWIRFSKQEHSRLLKLSSDLLIAAERLEKDDPGGACQILLISAVYQNHAGRRYEALRTTQRARALAERANLAREIIWCQWGACAITCQQGNQEQTANHLADLQSMLLKHNEWILADFVDVLRQSLLSGASNIPKLPRDPPSTDLLVLTLQWLQQWGYVSEAPERDHGPGSRWPKFYNPPQERNTDPSPNEPGQHPENIVFRAIRGEVKLQWVENHPEGTRPRRSVLHSILSSIRAQMPRRPKKAQTGVELQQRFVTASLPEKEILPPIHFIPPRAPDPADGQPPEPPTHVAAVILQMLGPFSITIQDSPLRLTSSRSLSLLKYLSFHHKQDIPREVLMDIFWPEADPEAARNNLNVAMHSLRQALRAVTELPMIRFEDGAYGLSRSLEVWLDLEEFERCVKEGKRLEARNQLTAAVIEYEIALNLYRGDFLSDSPYEDWTVYDRERLRVDYLETLGRLSRIYFGEERYADCVTLCQLILARDRCREDAHCRLMQCYSRLGQGPLALRQYQTCVEALRDELETNPAPETTRLYESLRRHEPI